ncbi:putative amino acid permease YhdG [mine drainage metagenome]|uniref:Putative amino acid permease YhdG n=1 Tax=mine drainage metagenome TaxID=410659 RepID=A0A1J5RHK9_9ZZZZ
MAEKSTATMKPTLGLTGLTMNAMALIAPGAFLWLTFGQQCLYGAPMAGSAMWFGILIALALCLATAVSYAELSKLYPGAGSSYVFAEQAFLRKQKAFKWARVAKFVIGWASHLYYWIYPGVMVGVTSILCGYVMGVLFPSVFSSAVPSPLFMYGFCVVFALGVSYIAYRGVAGATAVNVAINVIQITALLIFAAIALAYRINHPQGSVGYTLNPDGVPTNKVIAVDKDGNPVKNAAGHYVYTGDFKLDYSPSAAVDKGSDPKNPTDTFEFHSTAKSVVSPHGLNYALIQACIAILILVGFESVSAMGEEAKNAKRDIPIAIILSLVIQGAFCYLIEYFCANYFLNSGYTMTTAAGSAAPIGDMMQITGTWLFGSAAAGKAYMLVQAFTVFLALIGTTLSCISTGARVTYAMGRDEEMGAHFGMLHEKNLTPARSIWTLGIISAVIGIISVAFYFCNGAALADSAIASLPHNIWYSFGLIRHDTAALIPQSMLVVTLASNFGTFLLYMLTNFIAIVAFVEHHSFNTFKHVVIPVFGLLANLACMLFYLIGPFSVSGMSWKEPYIALGIAAVWGIWGAIYFIRRSKASGKPALLTTAPNLGS